MRYASITGWGKCLPPAVLTNDDLATIIETSDEWISSRTGMKERRIAHVECSDLAHVAAQRALDCAGLKASDLDLIIFGTCTGDTIVPNSASRVQDLLGAYGIAAMDLNTACTSGMYALSVATSMIRSGSINRVLIIGAEKTSAVLDWVNRDVSVLFGDGAAAFVLEATDEPCGLLGDALGCFGDARDTLFIQKYGTAFTNRPDSLATSWDFEGQVIFKKAVAGMVEASQRVLTQVGKSIEDIDLLIPHQANLRIIDAVGSRVGIEKEKVFINIQRYGNMSAATALVALVEAVEEKRVGPGTEILMPAFGAGLTWSSHFIRWGERATPLATSDIDLPPCSQTALELIQPYREQQRHQISSATALP